MVKWRKEAKFQAWWREQREQPHYDRCIAKEDIGDHHWWSCIRAERYQRESFARRFYSRKLRGKHRRRTYGFASDIASLRRRYQRQRRGKW